MKAGVETCWPPSEIPTHLPPPLGGREGPFPSHPPRGRSRKKRLGPQGRRKRAREEKQKRAGAKPTAALRTSFHDVNVAQGSVSSWKDGRAAWEGWPLGQSGRKGLMTSWPREMALGGAARQRLVVSKMKSSRHPHPAPLSSCVLPGGHLHAWAGTAPGQSSTGRSCLHP